MSAFLTVVGAGLILAGLLDMFHTLLHPSGTGRVSWLILSVVWRLSKFSGHRVGSAVGPTAMVFVVLMWVSLQGLGWALIYLPHIPHGFVYSPGIDPSSYPDFVESLYISVITLSTLGFGDVVPTDPWIRAVLPVEALTGFALLTAALTWFMQVYPPLSRRRTLALELRGLAEIGYAEKLELIETPTVARVLDALSANIGKVQIDFIQYTEGFYFQEKDPVLSLAKQLPYALQLRDVALLAESPTVRLSAQQLSVALDQLAVTLRSKFVHRGTGTFEVFAAYATEHGHDAQR